jgi:proline iminopeptidase
MKKILLLIMTMGFFACKTPENKQDSNVAANDTLTTGSDSTIKTGGNKLIRIDGKYNVWTKKIGTGRSKYAWD